MEMGNIVRKLLSSGSSQTFMCPPALVKYGFVTHAFIDGYSRLLVGIRVRDNNRAASVLELFLQATRRHGVPSRVRGDHGTENLEVAAWME